MLSRLIAMTLLMVSGIGMVVDFRAPARPNLHFGKHVKRFEQAPSGKAYKFPILLPGCTMTLLKK